VPLKQELEFIDDYLDIEVVRFGRDKLQIRKEIDADIVSRLVDLEKKFGISPSGEGGEIETTVLDAPLFKKKIEIQDWLTNIR
jgi:diphthamide synthase (EF-2-diphthine--ammonia ligase)